MQLEAMLYYDFELVENHPVADHRHRQNAMNDFVDTRRAEVVELCRRLNSQAPMSRSRTVNALTSVRAERAQRTVEA